MANPDKSTIERLRNKAKQSTCKFRISALGFNKSGICVIARSNKQQFSRKGGGFHAERLVMQEARSRGVCRILICRIGKGGAMRPIDPCPQCQSIADKLGIIIDTIPEE